MRTSAWRPGDTNPAAIFITLDSVISSSLRTLRGLILRAGVMFCCAGLAPHECARVLTFVPTCFSPCLSLCGCLCCALPQVMSRRCVGTQFRGCCSPAARTTPSSCGTSEGAKAPPSNCKDTSENHKPPLLNVSLIQLDGQHSNCRPMLVCFVLIDRYCLFCMVWPFIQYYLSVTLCRMVHVL